MVIQWSSNGHPMLLFFWAGGGMSKVDAMHHHGFKQSGCLLPSHFCHWLTLKLMVVPSLSRSLCLVVSNLLLIVKFENSSCCCGTRHYI
jgi:hypothetical protein